MITVEEIKRKADKLYPEVLRAAVLGESLFPKEIRANKKLSSDFSAMSRQLAPLIAESKDRKGYGYSICYEQVKTRLHGVQDRPASIVFDTFEDYLRFTGKQRQYLAFLEDIELILHWIPSLKAWVVQQVQHVLDYQGQWHDLLAVCDWFLQGYEPDRYYIRELPIPVHTKFIEEHKGVLRKLLDELVPHLSDPTATEFEKRFRLKFEQPCIRFRILDEELYLAGQLDDVSLPSDSFAALTIPCEHVFVVENLMNFLTFPKVPAAIVIWGKGFAVESLKEAAWLSSKNICYWSDLDVQGFQMLSQLRSYFPQTRSMLMDRKVLEDYKEYIVKGTPSNCQSLPHLTEEERNLFELLSAENLRLEQERIPQQVVIETALVMCNGYYLT
ncbi:Wadjet anti-phage system protein JetD domain-containing protein [Pontibacter virosus]|uniref:Wadjet protein JetD C-terminal domain-containing protein n=1 Tax=Pontibacter virosus TaxID=1765052 RepID=A0A2U1AWS4_9BACT|nr:Wadjet anti-phage system protein JetD domain-containing protein [Pontibacter virosus]PVY40879.1 hypothetical protein C8E01_106221 [Pontibacter virosus]